MAATTNWKLTLAYDGSGFHGWQIQAAGSGLLTIQGTLSEAIARLTGERILPQASGRTDAGVHALAQVVSVRLATPMPAANLQRALNRILPASIRVLSAEEVSPSFHARHSARSKTYEYRIFERRLRHTPGLPAGERICSPFLAPYAWDCPWPLALEPLQHAASLLVGTHDFTSMAASDPERAHRDPRQARSLRDPGQERSHRDLEQERSHRHAKQAHSLRDREQAPAHGNGEDSHVEDGDVEENPSSASRLAIRINPVKTITLADWTRRDGLLVFQITGNGFLHHMVRDIVGTLVEIGRGSLDVTDLPRILEARNRTAAGPTAPARGLYLVEVLYDDAVPCEDAGCPTSRRDVGSQNAELPETPAWPIHEGNEGNVMSGVRNLQDHPETIP